MLLDRGNYRGLKLTDQVLKVLERIIEQLVRQQVDINGQWEEWLIKVAQSFYTNARSQVRINGSFSKDFKINLPKRGWNCVHVTC